MKCKKLTVTQLTDLGVSLLSDTEEIVYVLSPNETVCAIRQIGGCHMWHSWDKIKRHWVQTHMIQGENWMLELE